MEKIANLFGGAFINCISFIYCIILLENYQEIMDERREDKWELLKENEIRRIQRYKEVIKTTFIRMFYAPGLKGLLGASSVSIIHLSVCLYVIQSCLYKMCNI